MRVTQTADLGPVRLGAVVSTIYDLDGDQITAGVQSQLVCDATINTAREIARNRGKTVVVEDEEARECYRVTLDGRRLSRPAGWEAYWEGEEVQS